jgi:hypothetical protein
MEAREAVRARATTRSISMKDLSDNELIKLYIKAAANESGDLPFGAEARRKEAGDELLARGITEIRLPAFVDPFPVKGSDVDARKCKTMFTRSGR